VVRLPTLTEVAAQRIVTGAEQLDKYLPAIRNKQIGMVVNPTSMVGDVHLVDTLCALQQCVARVFAPEHGFRGDEEAGAHINDDQDEKTGVPITSIYGKKKKPSREDLDCIEMMVFDVQDVGARFYTYITTLYYVMEACADRQIPLLILDRPNPNGHYTDGPVLDMRLESFVGIMPLPVVHGCTIGELALLFAGEGWINHANKLDLTIIPCLNYTHQTYYEPPIKPSPNLPNIRSVLLYPSICFFEGTHISLGRGTDAPFQILGAPHYQLDTFTFVPKPNKASKYPPNEGKTCRGVNLRTKPIQEIWEEKQLNLGYLLDFYHASPDKTSFFNANKFFDLLAGTPRLRERIVYGCSADEIRGEWQRDLEFFREIRKRYLLYAE
jgi:uncharacterized protein YbbC (DUF1343 family)